MPTADWEVWNMLRRSRVLPMAFVLLALLGSASLADTDHTGFEAERDRARALYIAGHWAEARTVFLSAYDIQPRPELLYFVANTYRREGRLDEALRYLRRYLALAPAADALRPQAEALARHLRSAVGERVLGASSTAQPGERRAAPDPKRRHRVLFWSSLAATGAGIVGMTLASRKVGRLKDQQLAAIKDLQSQGTFLDSNDACADARNYATAQAREVVSICSSGQRWAQISNGFAIGAVIGAGAAAFFYYKGYMAPGPKRERARLTPSVSRSGVGVSLDLVF